MSNVVEYKGYYGTVEFSGEDNLFYGKVIGVNSLISFEGDTVESLKNDFKEAIDDYLALCAEKNIQPEKTYKGSFNVRVSPQLHKTLAIYATSRGQTLNSVVEEAIEHYISS